MEKTPSGSLTENIGSRPSVVDKFCPVGSQDLAASGERTDCKNTQHQPVMEIFEAFVFFPRQFRNSDTVQDTLSASVLGPVITGIAQVSRKTACGTSRPSWTI